MNREGTYRVDVRTGDSGPWSEGSDRVTVEEAHVRAGRLRRRGFRVRIVEESE